MCPHQVQLSCNIIALLSPSAPLPLPGSHGLRGSPYIDRGARHWNRSTTLQGRRAMREFGLCCSPLHWKQKDKNSAEASWESGPSPPKKQTEKWAFSPKIRPKSGPSPQKTNQPRLPSTKTVVQGPQKSRGCVVAHASCAQSLYSSQKCK